MVQRGTKNSAPVGLRRGSFLDVTESLCEVDNGRTTRIACGRCNPARDRRSYYASCATIRKSTADKSGTRTMDKGSTADVEIDMNAVVHDH